MNIKMRVKIEKKVSYVVSKEVIDLFDNFQQSDYCTKSNKSNVVTFSTILLNYREINSVDDFSDDTFYEDFKMTLPTFSSYKNRPLSASEKALLKNLYCYLLNMYPQNFKLLTMYIINQNRIAFLVNDGFKIIKRNIFEDVPLEYDKWILVENNSLFNIDFTNINQTYLADALKRYIWEDTCSTTKTKTQSLHVLIKTLNLLPMNIRLIKFNDMYNIKNEITGNTINQSAAIYISHIRSMLKYFEEIHVLSINKTAWNILQMKQVRSEAITDYYSKEEIKSILQYWNDAIKLEKKESEEVLSRLQLIAILYVLNTAMRLETICNLKINDLNSVDNNYFYIADGKNEKAVKYNITPNIKKLHDEVLKLTKQYRNENSPFSQYLFVYKRSRGNSLDLINRRVLNNKVIAVSKILKISPLGITGVRNRFMNNIIYDLETENNGAIVQALSKHSLNVHYNHYFQNDVNKIALQLYGVTIGETELKGVVMKKADVNVSKKDIVLNGRGYCSSDNCNQNNVLDCLMCNYFRCTPANIPYFKNEIEMLEKELANETIVHEREFKNAKRKLNVEYLFKCYEIQDGENNNGNED